MTKITVIRHPEPPQRYQYDIIPRTWGPRLLLALALLVWIPIVGSVGSVAFMPYWEPRPVRSVCAPQGYPGCLDAQDELAAESIESCERDNLHDVCFAPLGRVSPELVRHLVQYYESEYRLRVGILTPTAIPPAMLNEDRGQFDAIDLADLMTQRFFHDVGSTYVTVIGLTPVDIYISTSEWRYAFGLRSPALVISTVRMDPAAYGLRADDDLMRSRVRKMVTKYIGLFHFGIPPSDDPADPMYDNILSPADLDRMGEGLYSDSR